MKERNVSLMRDVQIAHFSLIETVLYLDTHPCDEEALKALEYYSDKLALAMAKYEEECGALHADSLTDKPFDWVKTPFPWELEC